MDLKELLGEELFKQVKEKIGDKKIDLIDNYIPKSRFNEVNEKLKTTESKVKTYEKQLGETKDLLANSEEYKTKYEDLDKKYKNDLDLKDKEIINTKKQFLAENQLIGKGVKHTKLLMNQIDWDKISIDNDNLLGFNDILEEFEAEYSDLFPRESRKGTEGNINNSNQNNKSGGSPDDIDFEELLKDI